MHQVSTAASARMSDLDLGGFCCTSVSQGHQTTHLHFALAELHSCSLRILAKVLLLHLQTLVVLFFAQQCTQAKTLRHEPMNLAGRCVSDEFSPERYRRFYSLKNFRTLQYRRRTAKKTFIAAT